VPSGTQRDLRALEPDLLAWLRARHPDRVDLRINSLRHASAGLSNETVLVETEWGRGAQAETVVLRLPAEQMTFPDFDLATQARVQVAVSAAGVPTPVPVELVGDAAWIGVPFLVMPFVAGQVGPQAPAFDPWIDSLPPDRRRRVCDAFVDLVTSVQRIDVEASGLGSVLRGTGGHLAEEIAWWDDYLRWAGEGDRPPAVVTDLLAWCRANQPASEPPPSLLWGDPRLGNAIFDPDDRIVAALDWDMAFVGPAEHDVGWHLGLEQVGTRVAGAPVAGFPDRSEAVARYEAGLGRRLVDLGWYEVFALVRSIAVTVRQIRLATAAGVEYLVPPPDRSPVVPYAQELIARAG
jgi:aminoglycoside phosphotransferase (APT) family kinase protein